MFPIVMPDERRTGIVRNADAPARNGEEDGDPLDGPRDNAHGALPGRRKGPASEKPVIWTLLGNVLLMVGLLGLNFYRLPPSLLCPAPLATCTHLYVY